jgi:hypothetical protein
MQKKNSYLDTVHLPGRLARDSWCLRKHIHCKGDIVMNYDVPCKGLLLRRFDSEMELESPS